MALRAQKYCIETAVPKCVKVSGSFVGINGASPTTVIGDGFSVARSAEGTWVVTFDKPLAAFLNARVWVTDADTDYHEVTWTRSAANRTLTIVHRFCSYATIVSAGPAADDVVDFIGFEVDIVEADLGSVTGI